MREVTVATVQMKPKLGEPEDVGFDRLTLRARPVRGPFDAALSSHCRKRLRLFAAPPERTGLDLVPQPARDLDRGCADAVVKGHGDQDLLVRRGFAFLARMGVCVMRRAPE